MLLRSDATAVFLVHKGANEADDAVYRGIGRIGHDTPMPQFFSTSRHRCALCGGLDEHTRRGTLRPDGCTTLSWRVETPIASRTDLGRETKRMTPATRIVLHDLDLGRLLVIIQEYSVFTISPMPIKGQHHRFLLSL
jgi:hypothetical protein